MVNILILLGRWVGVDLEIYTLIQQTRLTQTIMRVSNFHDYERLFRHPNPVSYLLGPGGLPKMHENEGSENRGVLKKKGGFKLNIKIGNLSLRMLISGEVAWVLSKTCVRKKEVF